MGQSVEYSTVSITYPPGKLQALSSTHSLISWQTPSSLSLAPSGQLQITPLAVPSHDPTPGQSMGQTLVQLVGPKSLKLRPMRSPVHSHRYLSGGSISVQRVLAGQGLKLAHSSMFRQPSVPKIAAPSTQTHCTKPLELIAQVAKSPHARLQSCVFLSRKEPAATQGQKRSGRDVTFMVKLN